MAAHLPGVLIRARGPADNDKLYRAYNLPAGSTVISTLGEAKNLIDAKMIGSDTIIKMTDFGMRLDEIQQAYALLEDARWEANTKPSLSKPRSAAYGSW